MTRPATARPSRDSWRGTSSNGHQKEDRGAGGKNQNDSDLREGFLKEPIPTLEKLLGVDLPEEQLKQLAEGLKAKINLDKAGDFIGGLLGKK